MPSHRAKMPISPGNRRRVVAGERQRVVRRGFFAHRTVHGWSDLTVFIWAACAAGGRWGLLEAAPPLRGPSAFPRITPWCFPDFVTSAVNPSGFLLFLSVCEGCASFAAGTSLPAVGGSPSALRNAICKFCSDRWAPRLAVIRPSGVMPSRPLAAVQSLHAA